MIINRGAAEVDNHIPRDDIFDYHPLKNVIFIYYHPAIILTITCATLMRVRFERGDVSFAMADTCMMTWPGQFNLHITSLFVVKNIKCWYSFS